MEDLVIFCPGPVPLTLELHQAASGIAEKCGYTIYGALIVAAALQANGRILSEDMQHGQRIKDLLMRNPF